MRTITARVATKFLKKASSELEIHIFDFDGTLFRSPEEPSWWSRRRYGYWFPTETSLGAPFIPAKAPSEYWINSAVRDAKKSIGNMNAWTIMCTGRVDNPALRYRVAELLKQAGLDFDEVFLNDMGGDTAPYKKRVLINLLKQHPQVKKVCVWEDTQENLDALEAICSRVGVPFEGHLISVAPVSSDHISEEEYVEFLRGELPPSEFDKIYKALTKKGTL